MYFSLAVSVDHDIEQAMHYIISYKCGLYIMTIIIHIQ